MNRQEFKESGFIPGTFPIGDCLVKNPERPWPNTFRPHKDVLREYKSIEEVPSRYYYYRFSTIRKNGAIYERCDIRTYDGRWEWLDDYKLYNE